MRTGSSDSFPPRFPSSMSVERFDSIFLFRSHRLIDPFYRSVICRHGKFILLLSSLCFFFLFFFFKSVQRFVQRIKRKGLNE